MRLRILRGKKTPKLHWWGNHPSIVVYLFTCPLCYFFPSPHLHPCFQLQDLLLLRHHYPQLCADIGPVWGVHSWVLLWVLWEGVWSITDRRRLTGKKGISNLLLNKVRKITKNCESIFLSTHVWSFRMYGCIYLFIHTSVRTAVRTAAKK